MRYPNIILIGIDTFRADYFNQKNTPNLFRLAEEGVNFTNAFSTTIRTDPAFISIFTGKYPINHGVLNHGVNITSEEKRAIQSSIFLSEFLKSLGYNTYAVDWLYRWYKRGIDYYSGKLKSDSANDKSPKVTHNLTLKLIHSLDVLLMKTINRDFFSNFYHLITKEKHLYDRAEEVTNKAISYVKDAKEPFYIYLHYWDPHHPYISPPSIFKTIIKKPQERYEEELKYMDKHIARFIKYLKNINKFNDTLIIFFGDHGENINEHGYVIQHKGLYDSTIYIPLVFHFPKRFKSQKIDALVQCIDIFSTIVEFITPKILSTLSLDGKSLLPLIDKKTTEIRDVIFAEDFSPGGQDRRKMRRRCIRDNKYKYIQNIYGNKNEIFKRILDYDKIKYSEELYDIENDKKELKNINDIDKLKIYRKKMQHFLCNIEKKDKAVGISVKNTQYSSDSNDDEYIKRRLQSLGYL